MSKELISMAETIRSYSGFQGKKAIILGSGLGSLPDQFENKTIIPYEKVRGYPKTSVKGHSGEFVIGTLHGEEILAAKGRFHHYEGFDVSEITLPIRLFHELGIKCVLITNSAGSMRKDYSPGTFMAINGHLDCTFIDGPESPSPKKGAPFYNSSFLDLAKKCSIETGIDLKEGVYCWAMGPTYETPEEILYFQQLGGDVVGMSTVPEIQMAAECGIKSLGISCLTNYASGITKEPLTHEEVIETADKVKNQFSTLVTKILIEADTN